MVFRRRRYVRKRAAPMVRKKGRRVIRRKRRVRKTSGKMYGTLTAQGPGLPENLWMRHRYADVQTVGNGLSNIVQCNFAGNGLYDPNVTGDGSQPMYFDQVAALYRVYTVFSSAIRVSVYNDSGTALAKPFALTVQPVASQSAAISGNIDVSMSQPNVRWRYLRAVNAGTPSFVKHYAKSAVILGVKNIQDDPNTSGSASADPAVSRLWYWQIQVGSVDNVATVPDTVKVHVVIDYYTLWSQRKDVAGS